MQVTGDKKKYGSCQIIKIKVKTGSKKEAMSKRGGGKGVLGGLGGSEVLSQKENPYGKGPKVGGGV